MIAGREEDERLRAIGGLRHAGRDDRRGGRVAACRLQGDGFGVHSAGR